MSVFAAAASVQQEYTLQSIEAALRARLSGGKIYGTDTDDKDYGGTVVMWKKRLRNCDKLTTVSASTFVDMPSIVQALPPWYADAYRYWEEEQNCDISDDGVLGGYGKVTPMDIRDSNRFIDSLKTVRPLLQFDRAADCGAGIGRVSKHLLLHHFQQVDLVEQSPRLLKSSIGYIGAPDAARTARVEVGLQDFRPKKGEYDAIWIQWVVGHLHDVDFINFFRRCLYGLKPNGVIVLKDNLAANYTFVVDNSDSSVSRSLDYMRLLFEMSGLKVLLEARQTDFPEELYPVIMLALVDARES